MISSGGALVAPGVLQSFSEFSWVINSTAWTNKTRTARQTGSSSAKAAGLYLRNRSLTIPNVCVVCLIAFSWGELICACCWGANHAESHFLWLARTHSTYRRNVDCRLLRSSWVENERYRPRGGYTFVLVQSTGKVLCACADTNLVNFEPPSTPHSRTQIALRVCVRWLASLCSNVDATRLSKQVWEIENGYPAFSC